MLLEGAQRLLGAKLHEEELNEKDLARRARAYLNGYFRPLRRAALHGFNFPQKEAVLAAAEKMIPERFKGSSEHQKLWRRNIQFDLAQLKEMLDV